MSERPRNGETWRIAIIGWGSLLWDPDGMETWAVRRQDRGVSWRMGAGPELPLEFSRVSRKRPGALTLVIDEGGAICRTHVAQHAAAAAAADGAAALSLAAADLAARENAPAHLIGVSDGTLAAEDGAAPGAGAVARWLSGGDWDGAVWTALPSNFEAERGEPFSIEAAMAYLASLDGASLRAAVDYLEKAPSGVQTPLRRALARSPLWRRMAAANQRRLSVT